MKKDKKKNKLNPILFNGICHRGLHNEDYTENGLKAFKNSMDHHMAFEVDVHLTKDNELVVFHDFDLKRMTGQEGIVEEKTLSELKNNYRLVNGEKIPTLREVFKQTNEEVPIVIELKVYRKNYKELALRVKEELKSIKNKGNIVIISFDPRALFCFKKKDGFVRQLLVTTYPKYRYLYHFRFFFEGIDLEYTFLKKKSIRRYCMKHLSNVWTIENKEIFDNVFPYVDTITFQNMDAEYVKNKMNSKS